MTILKTLVLASAAALALAGPASAQIYWGGNWVEPDHPTRPRIPTVPPIVVPVPGVSPSTPDSGETRLTFGIRGKAPDAPVQGLDITTAELDAALRRVPAVNVPLTTVRSDFGDHYTRDLLNRGFEEIRDLEQGLERYAGEKLAKAVDPIVKVYSLDVDASPFHLRFAQIGSDLNAELGRINAKIVAKAKAPICGTIKVRGMIEDFSATASYDLVRGQEIDIGIKADKIELKDSTGNPLKWFCASIGKALFGNTIVANALLDGTGVTVDGYRIDRISPVPQSFDNTLVGRLDREFNITDRRFFGANELLVVTRHVLERPGTLPVAVAERQRQNALTAVSEAVDFINDPDFQGSGLQLDFVFEDARDNRVSLVASHNAPRFGMFEYTQSSVMIQVRPGSNTRRVFLYGRPGHNQSWRLLKTGHSDFVLGTGYEGWEMTVVGESAAISGLYSDANARKVVRNDIAFCNPHIQLCREVY